MRRCLLAVTFALLASAQTNPKCFEGPPGSKLFTRGEFQRCNEYEWFTLHWSVDEAGNTLKIGAIGKVDGWLGFGLSSSGSMKGADIMVGRFDSANGDAFVLEDRYADDFVMPSLDAEQNVELLEGGSSGGYTWWVGTRRLRRNCNSLERLDDLDVQLFDSLQNMLFAGGRSHTFGYHNIRTTRVVNLFEEVAVAEPAGTQMFSANVTDLNGTDYTVPTDDTTYWCTPFSAPADKNYHMVKVSVTPDSELLHHLVVFACTRPHPGGSCKEMDRFCSALYYSWSPGMEDFYAPLEAGLPFGKDGTVYFALQAHFDNPSGTVGIVDRTSISFDYTDELREHDLGAMLIGGPIELLKIDPGHKAFFFDRMCPGECLAHLIPEGGITIVQTLEHMHSYGRSSGTEIIRNGKVIKDLTWKRYDFNHQRASVDKFQLMPGDSMRHWCTYDTMRANETITGGLSTQTEMCFAFSLHYPASIRECTEVTGVKRRTDQSVGYNESNPSHGVMFCQPTGDSGYWDPENLLVFNRSSIANNYSLVERVNEVCGE
ncbi:MOXD1-like protein 1, partial [Diplonema papillatum]